MNRFGERNMTVSDGCLLFKHCRGTRFSITISKSGGVNPKKRKILNEIANSN